MEMIENSGGHSVINHSKLFDQLINKDGQMNDIVASFLYYMYPRELFIRALSLIESRNMFIYMLVSKSNLIDESLKSSKVLLMSNVVDSIYEDSELHRLIVKLDEHTPIYVDLNRWMCSCKEYTDLMLEQAHLPGSLLASLLNEIRDPLKFREDRYGQLDAHSLSMQRYVEYDRLNCPHLLAYSILLRSSTRILLHFLERGEVLLIHINSLDEWLKLHINMI